MIFNSSRYNDHWHNKKLSELGNFRRGRSRHRPRNDPRLFENGTYPMVQTGDVKAAELYIRSHETCYNELGLSQSVMWPENTLCITIAANIAETALLGYPMCFPDSVVGFNADPKESSELFMHYVFTYIRKAIQNSASGSIQDNINIDYLTELKFKIPEKPYQKKIVAILSSLDKKIELNNRINAELETMARTLYDYWFVQFDFPNVNGKPYKTSGGKMVFSQALKREIPEGWDAVSLSNVTQVSNESITPSDHDSKYFKLFSIPVFDATKSFGLETGDKIGSNKFTVEERDILVSKLNPWFSRVIYALDEDNLICSTEFVVWRTSNSEIKNFLYMVARSQQFIAHCTQSATGTSNSHKRVNPDVMMRFQIPFQEDLAEALGKKLEPIIRKIAINQREIATLVKLRDWLLPVLMNGQVTVSSPVKSEAEVA